MTADVEFWFDFSSPYGYFASYRIDAIAEAAGRKAVWRPIMLGSVFAETGAGPVIDVPLKGAYCVRDWERLGRYHRIPWVLPNPFPIAALAASRVYYWLEDQDVAAAHSYAKACYRAYFGEGRDIRPVDVVAELVASVGISADAVPEVAQSAEWKDRLKSMGKSAVSKGVCGSPYMIVDGEGFWGNDRLDMVAEWLFQGGF